MNDYQQFPVPHGGGGYSSTATAGASNRVRLAKEELICPLCMSFYKNPRSLQCLHSYCEECLVGLHSSSKCSDTVQCPECRARTLLPGGGVQDLPINFKLKRFVEILTSEEKEEFMKSLGSKRTSASISTTQLQCSRHLERPLEYYCEPCKLLICGQCMISEHRPHGDINYAINVLPLHIKHLRKHLPVASSVMAQGLSAMEALESIETELKQNDEERVTEVEQYFAEMHRILEERERDILDSFQSEVKHKVKLVSRKRQALRDSIESVRKSMLSIEDIAERRTDDLKVLIEEDAIKERLHARMKAVESDVKQSEKSLAHLQLGFKPDPALEMLCKGAGNDLQSSGPKFHLIRADTSPTIGGEFSLEDPLNKPRTLSAGDVHVCHPDLINAKRHSLDSAGPLLSTQKHLQQPQQPSSLGKLNPIADGEILDPVSEISAKGMVGASKQITPYPFGLAVANDNNTFLVADIKNHCISIVTTTGKFLDRIGSEGKGDGQLLEPTAIATDLAGNIYVAEKGNLRIQKFSSAGKFITKFRTKGLMTSGNYLADPMGIAITDDGTVLVSDCEKGCIQMFDDSGKYLGKFGRVDASRLSHPAGIVTKQGRVIVADRGNHCLWIYTSAGQLLARFGQQGSNPGDLYFPVGVAIDDDGNIFVSESGNHRISVFTAGGKFVRCFGRKGTDPGMFQNPRHLCFDPQSRLVVADEQNQRLQIFSVNINYYGTVGQRGACGTIK